MEIKKTAPQLPEGPGDDIDVDMAIDVNVDDGQNQDWGGGDAEGFDGAGDDD